MSTKWRISSFSGVLLAAYFIPTWVLIAYRIMVSPVQGFFERPNVSAAFFVGDYLHLASTGTVRAAWLLALGRLTVAGFFAVFLVLVSLPRVRKAGGCNEALAIALAIGSVISFALMLMASHVGEVQALRLHATELLMMLGTAIILTLEGPVQSQAKLDANVGVGPLAPEQPQLLNNS
jgi:cytochrome bd-type quinol oxidase subunit 1